VTCHDGFTLQDLVSYETKHNLANGEDNQDGTNQNLSRNWGVEGPTDAVRTLHIRERMKRNFLATLAFSQGVPMLSHGDELGRTQSGNNNAYCQDGPLTWVDWRLAPQQQELLQFTRKVFALRAETPALRRPTFFPHEAAQADKELTWLKEDGQEMTAEEWGDPSRHVLGMLMRCKDSSEAKTGSSDSILLLLNGGGRSKSFVLPPVGRAGTWTEVVNTSHPTTQTIRQDNVILGARTLLLLRLEAER
jgi:glycogen operon protein